MGSKSRRLLNQSTYSSVANTSHAASGATFTWDTGAKTCVVESAPVRRAGGGDP